MWLISEVNRYGFNRIIREYCRYPFWLPLPFEMEHGWSPLQEPGANEMLTQKPLMLVFSKRREQAWQKGSDIPVAVMGSPFVHYRRMHRIRQLANACGTIVFPYHSIDFGQVEYDVDKFCRLLQQLPQDFKPITICLYYDDFQYGVHERYAHWRFSVTTAGNKFNPNFAENFYNLLKRHRYSLSNMVGSHTFYSVEMGLPFFVYGDIPVLINDGTDPNLPIDYRLLDLEYERYTYKLFDTGPSRHITTEQQQFVEKEMGIHDCLSRSALNKLSWKTFLRHELWRLLTKCGKRLYK